ncbi:MAG: anaerobic ribonucleoside-triphosphate reductase activating protein [Clostridia bacterium]|nr:anaerobic ribonucleoside-triphosphate reductase activating protein [Clostridia bacterium]
MRIMDFVYSSSVDGTGFRDVLFVNYCPHHCEGCHNPESWDKANGHDITIEEAYKNLTKSEITNVTFSGGEPFEQAEALATLADMLKQKGKTIWVYSGYTFEQLIKDPVKLELLKLCDVLVDGRFDINQKGLNMRFKGSHNQRILDVKKSLQSGTAVEADV